MTSSTSINDFTLYRISGPVIVAVPPGRDPRLVSSQARILTRPRVITRWRRETGCG